MHAVLPVLIVLRNNLHLTRPCLKSVEAQDIPVMPWLIDNGSTDGTQQWAATQRGILYTYYAERLSVAQAWNIGLSMLFEKMGFEAAIVLNNDTELRPDTARLLLEDGGGFVTAVGVRERKLIETLSTPDPNAKRPHPDFSCYLIRKSVYEQIGPFDENFHIAFCEDGDYDLRLYKDGIRAYCLDLPFLHHGSMTVKNAEPAEIRRIQIQADKNREYFKRKWGFAMGSEEYYRALDKGGPAKDA